MTIRTILTEPNTILRQISVPVDSVGKEEQKLMDDMLETMYNANGIGLAAIQIGVPKRIIVIDISKKEDDERWDSAREIIRQALEAGTLTSWFEDSNTEDSNTQEKYIQKSDWAIPKGDSFADSYATLSYGTLQHGNRGLRGTVVYVRIKEADVFLRALTKVSLRDQFISEAAKIIKNDLDYRLPNYFSIKAFRL